MNGAPRNPRAKPVTRRDEIVLGLFARGNIRVGGHETARRERIADDFEHRAVGTNLFHPMGLEFQRLGDPFENQVFDVAGSILAPFGVIAEDVG